MVRFAVHAVAVGALLAGCDAASSPATTPARAPVDDADTVVTEEARDAGEQDAVTPPPEACPSSSPRQLAFLSTGTCTDVAGTSGNWRARSLFEGAPDVVRSRACGYTWSSPGGAPPERAPLVALAPLQLTSDCEPVGILARRGVVTEIVRDATTADVDVPTGVTGCDVCGKILERHVYLILPVDPTLDRSVLAVGTTSGALVGFHLTRPSPRVQVFAVELPDVEGRTYASKVSVLAAP